MTTAFSTLPGFYAAQTDKTNPRVPPRTLRIYVARLEAYDMPVNDDEEPGLDTQFTILGALAAGNPEVANSMLLLAQHVEANRTNIESELK